MENNRTPPAFEKPPYFVSHSRCDGVYDGEEHWALFAADCHGHIADLDGGLTPEAEALAEFIAHACNAHEDLLRELKLASKFLSTIDPAAIIAAENELGIGLAPANIIAAVASAEPVPNDAHEHAA